MLIPLFSIISVANAFWRLPCYSRLGVFRIDPIVSPGVPSQHAHTFHGADGFDFISTHDDLFQSSCTSCAVLDDMSVYWTPLLMFQHDNGTIEAVKQNPGMLVYYFLFGDDIVAFPKDFRMVAGDANRRKSTLPDPVPPQSFWGPNDTTQESLAQKALGFNCMDYDKPEGALQRPYLPDKTIIDTCPQGLRLELGFPSCWDGQNIDSSDHKSHIRYPHLVMEGTCPDGYTTHVPALYFETIWNTMAFKDVEGKYFLSNGDMTGYSYHGDFLNGWRIDTLQQAINTCTNLSGRIEDCTVFSLQSMHDATECRKEMPQTLAHDDCLGPTSRLCGNISIQ